MKGDPDALAVEGHGVVEAAVPEQAEVGHPGIPGGGGASVSGGCPATHVMTGSISHSSPCPGPISQLTVTM